MRQGTAGLVGRSYCMTVAECPVPGASKMRHAHSAVIGAVILVGFSSAAYPQQGRAAPDSSELRQMIKRWIGDTSRANSERFNLMSQANHAGLDLAVLVGPFLLDERPGIRERALWYLEPNLLALVPRSLDSGLTLLQTALRDPSPQVRIVAAQLLAECLYACGSTAAAVRAALDDPDKLVRRSAIWALAHLGSGATPAIPKLIGLATNDSA